MHNKWLFYATEFLVVVVVVGIVMQQRRMKTRGNLRKIIRRGPGFGLGPMRACVCRDAGAPHHGADDPGDVDGVVAAGNISGWVVLVTGASVQDGEANVQDVLLKLSPERLCLEVRASPIFQTLP